MPTRLSKRQQRQQEELFVLGGSEKLDGVSEEDSESKLTPVKGGFSAVSSDSCVKARSAC